MNKTNKNSRKLSLSSICEYRKGKVEVSKLNNNNYISTENMLSEKKGIVTATSLPKVLLTQEYKKGDILVSNIRPYFKKVWKARFNGGCSNDVLVFKAKEDVNEDFLYYILANDDFFDYSMATSKGTKMPRGDKNSIMQYEITVFDIDTQVKIGKFLRTIDEKIELNNMINNNLEQQAKALFKSWFVDFEPFGGEQPSEMQFVPLKDLCKVITKGTTPTTLGKPFTASGINFIKAESILDSHSIDSGKFAYIDEETNMMLKRSIIMANDIVFTIAGTLGRFALVDDSILPANTNQAVAIIRPDTKKITPSYLYSFFIGNWHNDYYSKRVQQAVQANLSLTTIKSLPIPVMNEDEMSKYNELVSPLFALMKSNEAENCTLAKLRDSLLPKLMSGELDVSDIDL